MLHTLKIYHENLSFKNQELEKAYSQLESAQLQIIQQEKMVSIGLLAAGVAHEINNPMGFIISNIGSLKKYTNSIIEYFKIQEEILEELNNSKTSIILKKWKN